MSTTVNPLRLRDVLGRKEWLPPREFGPVGMVRRSAEGATAIVTAAPHDGIEYVHASIATTGLMLPSYGDLVTLHKAAFADGYAYQVFAPAAQHVNLHPTALHLWGRLDGKPCLPEFGAGGSI